MLSFFVYFVSQCAIPTFGRFFLEIFYNFFAFVAVTLLVVVALAIGSFVAYQCYIKRCKCHRMSLCDHHRPQNEAVFYRDGHVYFEGGEDLNNVSDYTFLLIFCDDFFAL